MARIFFIIILLTSLYSQDFLTLAEQTNFQQTSDYEQTLQHCRKLAAAFHEVTFGSMGVSASGYDIPLMVVDKDGLNNATEISRSGRLILLIQAGIHSGEICGKDAGLLLIRDILQKKEYHKFLDHVSILFIPVLNVDGFHRLSKHNRINQNGPEQKGRRVNDMYLNLNRDYLKLDTPEIQAWVRLYNKWNPDFFIDIHSTDGADYQYVATYMLEIYGNMDAGLTSYTRTVYEPYLVDHMKNSNMPIFPYVNFRNWHNPESGLIAWVASPRLSQGYTAIRNRIGLLIETHMLKPYKQRVMAAYHMVNYTMELLNRDFKRIRKMNIMADNRCASGQLQQQYMPLRFRASDDSTMVPFLGFAYDKKKSDLSGGIWFRYSQDKKQFILPYFNKMEVTDSVQLPQAYLLSPAWKDLLERLRIHGIKMDTLHSDTLLRVEVTRFEKPKWEHNPYEGRFPLQVEMHRTFENRSFGKGTIVIPTNQIRARVIAHILEPQAPDSYVFWGFFNAVFEQKEYAESYVMEKMAREMLQKSPEMSKKFSQWKQKHPEAIKNPRAVLNWFYQQTPFWDSRKNEYPVYRIIRK